MKFASRTLLLSCLLAVALAQVAQAGEIEARALISLGGNDAGSTSGGANTPTSSSTTTTTSSSTTTSPTTSPTSSSTTSTPSSPSTSSPASTSNPQQQQSSTDNNTKPTSTPQQSPSTTHIVTTNSDGQSVTITQTHTGTSTSSSASSSASSASDSSDSSGLGTGSIVGLAVAGGVAVLGIVAFIVWKFTRKRLSDFDDNEAIKWPELNAHSDSGGDSHPLPAHNTGRAGFDSSSEVSLSRAPSQTGTYSTPDLSHNDPYAVPPLPHLNPGQPMAYRDDPNAGGYYDPYRGPVPNTFNEPPPQGPGEVYAMTQLGRASPAPQMMSGRASPGPQMAFGGPGRTASPAPAYGRASPAPQMAYGGNGQGYR